MKRKMFQRKGSSTNLREIKHEPKESKEVKEENPRSIATRPRSVSSFTIFESSNVIQSGGPQFVVPKARTKPQFGIHPSDLLEKYPEESVPAIVVACITALKKDLMKEGIFRIPGRMTDILEMKISFEQGHGLGTDVPDTYAVAGLLSQFFRELPEPLLMYDLYQDWVQVPKLDQSKILKRCVRLLKKLPEANYNLLKYFIEFLTQVSKHSGANRMGPKNLALVFGASLLNPLEAEQYDLANIKCQCDLIEHFITNYSYIFEGDKSITSKGRAEKQVATIPAGAPGSSKITRSDNKKKKRFFDRAQFSSSTHNNSRMCVSVDNITPPRKIMAASSISSESCSKVVKKKEESKKKGSSRRKKKHTHSKSEVSSILN